MSKKETEEKAFDVLFQEKSGSKILSFEWIKVTPRVFESYKIPDIKFSSHLYFAFPFQQFASKIVFFVGTRIQITLYCFPVHVLFWYFKDPSRLGIFFSYFKNRSFCCFLKPTCSVFVYIPMGGARSASHHIIIIIINIFVVLL